MTLKNKYKLGAVLSAFTILSVQSQCQPREHPVSIKNQARNFAILAARNSNRAYSFCQKLVFSPVIQRNNADSATYYVDQANLCISSSRARVPAPPANDSIEMGLTYLNLCAEYLRQANNRLNLAKAAGSQKVFASYGKQAMYLAGNAIVEAYNASFYLKGNSTIAKDSVFDEHALAKTKTTEESASSDTASTEANSSSEVTRLEVDETTLFATINRYEKQLSVIQSDIEKNEQKASNSEEIAGSDQHRKEMARLMSEKKEVEIKLRGSNEKLSEITGKLYEAHKKKPGKEVESKRSFAPPEFRTDMLRFYNDSNPIPIDKPLPAGLIYQIQIGYFSKDAKPDWPDGLFPLIGYNVSANYIQYATGIFYTYADANQGLNSIKKMGIADAFIIAKHNDNRISITEAFDREKFPNIDW